MRDIKIKKQKMIEFGLKHNVKPCDYYNERGIFNWKLFETDLILCGWGKTN